MNRVLKELFDLTGHTALCTGATSGIGRRMAIALSQAGADVVLVGRQEDQLLRTAETIDEKGTSRSAILVADLLERDGLSEIVAEARSKLGAPSILINAAGINLREPVEDVTLGTWDDTLNLNLAVPFFLARECVPGMLEKGRGKIINVASLQSFRAFANSIPYGASKGGVVQLTRAMAEAWSSQGILTNAIAPGFFRSRLTAPVWDDPDILGHNAQMTAIGRNGLEEDIDGVTVFLAARASDYITGQVIGLDGGYSAK